MRAEWTGRAQFAELAEALQVSTEDVMAATAIEGGRGWLILWTTDTHLLQEATVHRALLERDQDGVLQVVKKATIGPASGFLPTLEDLDLPEPE